MIIKDMFAKPIDRDIKGVIKVGQDDEANVKQELEEYVVTKELQKHFSDFFSAYKKGINGYTDKMGVWISGFFGSGKSHFLKILSYLLANKEAGGKRAIDYFIEDHKITDSVVLADMKLAASIPCDAVLFNIDSKSEVSGNQSKNAIVAVLQNVFNEMQGFSGTNPFLADLERNLSKNGKYEEFQEKFQERCKVSWQEGRNDFDFIQDDVVEVLSDMGAMSEETARNWCEKATGEYPYQIEKFAKLIKEYIDRKGNNQHIVFLIDEMGQYIGGDSKLMLNLQTVTEDLGTSCQGKAWIIVTSQQDIDSITKVKGNDFSKIQGRFDTRLSLSSANADEVIKKRILAKTETGEQTLELLYDDEKMVIKNLIVFNDEIEKKLYKDKKDFSDIYPFIPYQFFLLGKALTEIRMHGASGKHLAEGERSMLALFQESAIKLMKEEPGKLVPFHFFYDALEQFLDHSHKGVISQALDNERLNPNHEKDCFDVNVLKTLFLIKYVKEIKSTVENITTLMISDIHDDRINLRKNVEDALNRLIRQTLVQKNGDIYVFLTNEEQEIRRSIEKQPVETAEIQHRVAELIFEDIYAEKKYRKQQKFNGRYSFAFNQVVDDKPYMVNQNHELTLKILTPNSDEIGDSAMMCNLSSQKNCVLVVLPEDRSFLDEISAVLKIEKFMRQDMVQSIVKYDAIKLEKQNELIERKERAKLFLKGSLEEAEIYVCGNELPDKGKNIPDRIDKAMEKLVSQVYFKLDLITSAKNETDLRALFEEEKEITLGGIREEDHENIEALREMESYISNKTRNHARVSLKSIMNYFLKAPYGFIEDDVQWLVAKLFKNGKIGFFINNKAVTLFSDGADEIIRLLTRKDYREKLMLEVRNRVDENQKKAVKKVVKNLFGTTLTAQDDDFIMMEFREKAGILEKDLEITEKEYEHQRKYPGREVIQKGKNLLFRADQCQGTDEFFGYINQVKDDFLDFAEKYERVKSFFSGKQREIFDEALQLIDIYDSSTYGVVNEELTSVASEIKEILGKGTPYSEIYKLPELIERFKGQYDQILNEMKKPVDKVIDEARERVLEKLQGKQCADRLLLKYIDWFDEVKRRADNCKNVTMLQGIKQETDDLKIKCLNEIEQEESSLKFSGKNPADESEAVPKPMKKNKTVSIRKITPAASWQIENEADVKRYLSELEKQLMKVLEKDTVIHIEF